MALLPTNQRDQMLVLACIVAFGGVGAYWYLMYAPKQAEITTMEARADTLEQTSRAARVMANPDSVASLRRQAVQYRHDLESVRRLVPTANEVPALLEQVSTAARRAGLDISKVNPMGVVPGDQFDTYKYELGVTGGYHQIGAFLANVGSLQRIVAPINLSLQLANETARGPGAQAQQASSSRARVVANFEIKTYVAKTAAPAPASAPATRAASTPRAAGNTGGGE